MNTSLTRSHYFRIHTTMLILISTALCATDTLARQNLGVTMYDNITEPRFGGRTVLNESRGFGFAEIGDDLNLARYEPGTIAFVGWTAANLSDATTLTNYTATVRFYNLDTQQLIATIPTGDFTPQLSIPPGRSHSIGVDFSFLGISAAPRMYMTFQFTSVTGIAPSEIGMLIGGPTTVGTSSRFIRNFTTGQDIDLGGDNRNLGFQVRVRPIPTPSALGIFGLATIFAARRRR